MSEDITMSDERLALVSARESAGWNSPPSVPVWAVSPDLSGSYDEVYFQTRDDATEYIQENVGEKISGDFTDEELAETGFELRLWRKLISPEQFDAVFSHGEAVDVEEA